MGAERLAVNAGITPKELHELANQLVAVARRAALMEAQVDLLEGKRRSAARLHDAILAHAALARELAGLPDGGAGPKALKSGKHAADDQPSVEAGGPMPPGVSRMILTAQEDLRREIARQMHDGPAQSLTNIVLQAQIVDRLLAKAPEKATEEVDKMNKEGNALVEEYKSLSEKSNNPALTADAKEKAQADAQKKFEEIQRKQQEIQQFIGQTRQSLAQRFQTFKNLMLEEISKTAAEVAKRKGATLLIDKSGPSVFGVSNILYTDTGYDITDEVMKELNKDRPANAPTTAPSATTAAPAPAATTPAPAAGGGITVPGLKK